MAEKPSAEPSTITELEAFMEAKKKEAEEAAQLEAFYEKALQGLVEKPDPYLKLMDITAKRRQAEVGELEKTAREREDQLTGKLQEEIELSKQFQKKYEGYQTELRKRSEDRPKINPWAKGDATKFSVFASAMVVASIAGPYFAKMGTDSILASLNGALTGLWEGNMVRYKTSMDAMDKQINDLIREYDMVKEEHNHIILQKNKEYQVIIHELNALYRRIGATEKDYPVMTMQDAVELSRQFEKLKTDARYKGEMAKAALTNAAARYLEATKKPNKDRKRPGLLPTPATTPTPTAPQRSWLDAINPSNWFRSAPTTTTPTTTPAMPQRPSGQIRVKSVVQK